jgi:cytochrome c peroxidase
LERQTAALTGAATSSIPAVTLRNAIVTQPFAPELLTPDGRLGVKRSKETLEETLEFEFIAFGDPAVTVVGGAPRFAGAMAHGATKVVRTPRAKSPSTALHRFTRDRIDIELPAGAQVKIWTPSGQGALSLDPRYSPAGKPFPVNAPGDCESATPATRHALISPGSPYECYRLIHLQPFFDGASALPLYQAEVAVVVDARRPRTSAGVTPRAERPNVVSAKYLTDFEICSSNGQYFLWALEASATADARLVVSERGSWSFNETPWRPNTWSKQRELGAMFQSVQRDDDGVRRICRQIDAATGAPSCTPASEEDFARVYPLAAAPFYLADGMRRTDNGIPTHLECGYTWVTPEGTDVFCRPNPDINSIVQPPVALELPQGFESSTGMHFFAFGQHTGWMLRRLDSAINSRRFNPERLEPLSLQFVSAGATPGLVCTQISESADPAGTWDDNFLCANRDIGLRWSSAGPIANMRCTQINEPAEPPSTTWDDNFLCVPPTSQIKLAWSYAGPLPEGTCIPWTETADPHTWLDNFLCHGAMSKDQDPADRPFSPVFLNTSTGFWADNRVSAAQSFPLFRKASLFQFMTQGNGVGPDRGYVHAALGLIPNSSDPTMWTNMQYWEASFECGTSPTCLIHLPMNELFYDQQALPVLRALPRTHDTSNNTDFFDAQGDPLPALHPYIAELQGAARFVGEVYGASVDARYLSGYRGTAISLGASGAVSVSQNAADSPACRRNKGCLGGHVFDDGFTAQVAFLLLFDPSAAALPIAVHHGVWSVEVISGAIVAKVTFADATGARATATLTSPQGLPFAQLSDVPAVQAPKWRHVALRAAPDELRVFLIVNGKVVAAAPLPAGATFTGTAAGAGGELVRVGPGGSCTGCGAGEALFVDELMIHRSALNFEEIAASASEFAGQAGFLPSSSARALLAGYFAAENPRALILLADGFPAFVDPDDLRVPAAFGVFLGSGGAQSFRKLVAVGDALFHSPVLSTNSAGVSQAQAGTRELMSCATCHRHPRTFTDGRVTALGIHPVPLNTPTIVNRAFGTNQFFARRSDSLIDLALRPVMEPTEMNGDIDRILKRINSGSGADQVSLRKNFKSVFGNVPVQRAHLELALTAFELVQLSTDSLATAVITADKLVVDAEGTLFRPELVKLGQDLFESKARCTACHVGPNFSDELPHDTGVAATPRALKTPTLWEISGTAPYFHDGSRATLRQVLEFYNRGGDPPGRVRDGRRVIDPELRPLALSERELEALELYLRALVNAKPVLSQSFNGLAFSSHGPIPGMSCISVDESADPHGWRDNYLCSPTDRGIRWSSAGPIAGMRCTAIREGLEPEETTWSDNYLCVPATSPLRLSWSMSGPLFGRACTRYNEPEDHQSWGDNFLCWDEPLTLRFSAEGPIAGMTCTHVNELADLTGGWDDNYVCASKEIGLRWSMAGPIAGMRCTRVHEDAEPPTTTWGDNYLCVPPESDAFLSWSQAGPIPGLACAQMNEPRDPHTWLDNFLCYREQPLSLQFFSAGAPAGSVCTQISESADAAGTWNDNFLCANRDIGLRWSSAGPIANMRCTQIEEPAEPASTTWDDNFLCLPPTSQLKLAWSYAGPLPEGTCTPWTETADPHTWLDNFICHSP